MADRDEMETLSQMKKRIKKNTAGGEAKKSKKPSDDDSSFQVEDGAGPEDPEGATPAKEKKE